MVLTEINGFVIFSAILFAARVFGVNDLGLLTCFTPLIFGEIFYWATAVMGSRYMEAREAEARKRMEDHMKGLDQ